MVDVVDTVSWYVTGDVNVVIVIAVAVPLSALLKLLVFRYNLYDVAPVTEVNVIVIGEFAAVVVGIDNVGAEGVAVLKDDKIIDLRVDNALSPLAFAAVTAYQYVPVKVIESMYVVDVIEVNNDASSLLENVSDVLL